MPIVKKKERSQITNLPYHLKKHRKTRARLSQSKRRKKIRVKINKIQNRKTMEKIFLKSCFFEKTKFDKLLAKGKRLKL